MGQLVSEQEVQFYDIAVPDWPGEIDFYRALAIDVKERGAGGDCSRPAQLPKLSISFDHWRSGGWRAGWSGPAPLSHGSLTDSVP